MLTITTQKPGGCDGSGDCLILLDIILKDPAIAGYPLIEQREIILLVMLSPTCILVFVVLLYLQKRHCLLKRLFL